MLVCNEVEPGDEVGLDNGGIEDCGKTTEQARLRQSRIGYERSEMLSGGIRRNIKGDCSEQEIESGIGG